MDFTVVIPARYQSSRFPGKPLANIQGKPMVQHVVDRANEAGASKVFLHGNHIATVTEDTLELFDGGWQSVTTKSRLNALCSAFAYAGEGVFQQDWKWYVRRWVGNLGAQSCWKTEAFVSGYVLA